MLSTLGGIALIALASTMLVEKPLAAIQAIPQLFAANDKTIRIDVAGAKKDEQEAAFQKVDIRYDAAILSHVEITSNRRLLLTDGPSIGEVRIKPQTIEAKRPLIWNSKMGVAECPLPLYAGAEVFVQNQEIDPADLEIRLIFTPALRESSTFIFVAIFVTIFGLLFMLMQAVSPKVAGCVHESNAEVPLPNPIHHHARRERIVRAGNP